MRLPQMLGTGATMSRAQTDARAHSNGPALQPLAIRKATVRLDAGGTPLTVVRGVSPDPGGTPSGWVCTETEPQDLEDQPIGCRTTLSFDEQARAAVQSLLNVLIGLAVGAVITLALAGYRQSADAAASPGSG